MSKDIVATPKTNVATSWPWTPIKTWDWTRTTRYN